MDAPYKAECSWSSARPHTMVICCSDGRWHTQNTEFVAQEIDTRPDLYAVPGGAAVIDPWNSSFDEARVFDKAMRLFIEFHELRSVWLISHHDCAFYRVRHPELDEAGRLVRQRADLLRAARLLREAYPQLMLRCVHANLVGDKVVYEPVG